MRITNWKSYLAVLLVVANVGCGDGKRLRAIALSPSTPVLTVGSTQTFKATGIYRDNHESDISRRCTWSSSNPTIASVSPDGIVKALATGVTNISATSEGISGATNVTVATAHLQSIRIESASTFGSDSRRIQFFTARGYLKDGSTIDLSGAVTWRSSDTHVATINEKGVVSAGPLQEAKMTNITASSGNVTSDAVPLVVSP
jgi:uncharacterized protein YjdB